MEIKTTEEIYNQYEEANSMENADSDSTYSLHIKNWIAVDDLLKWIKKECINEWENCGGALKIAIKNSLKKKN